MMIMMVVCMHAWVYIILSCKISAPQSVRSATLEYSVSGERLLDSLAAVVYILGRRDKRGSTCEMMT